MNLSGINEKLNRTGKNAVPVSSWFNDPHDTELTDLCPFLADLSTSDDVRGVLDGGL